MVLTSASSTGDKVRILGIDPGSRITGYGIIDHARSKQEYVVSGCIRTPKGALPERLGEIFANLSQIIIKWQPHEVAVETVFMHRNPGSALKLGQARGAAICAAVAVALPVSEYSARQIKQAIVGYGAASKSQVQQMISTLLHLSKTPQEDAADALAAALCHAQARSALTKLSGVTGYKQGRMQ